MKGMFRRSHRLSKEQFDETMEKGRVFHSPLFLMRVFDASDGKGFRAAAVAPKKIARTAVVRNTMRRRIYAAAGPLLGMTRDADFHAIVFATGAATTATVVEMTRDLRGLFVKAGVLR
jgi:ribonuclease P protein component